MKKFIIKLSIFICVVVVLDFAFGLVFQLYDHTKSDEIHRIHSIMTYETPELVILGSSRASHHYVPSILKDSLGVSVYNAGLNGKGTATAYGLLQGLAQRGYPKYIICELTPIYDIYQDKSSSSFGDLYPYIRNRNIKEMIIDFDSSQKLKLCSNAYRLNSALLKFFTSVALSPEACEKWLNRHYSAYGYLPLYGEMNDFIPKEITREFVVDSVKVKYLEKLITEAQSAGSKLIFTISPVYSGSSCDLYKDEIGIINRHGLPILDYLNDKCLIDSLRYYQDAIHLNDNGAVLYSRYIANDLKQYIRQDSVSAHN